ncbi:MAG: NACHT domain-containing protein [Chloroflexi bacterium]|nr:NACHT domain-containing protein [Chloroflexota bacterium]
MNALLAAFTPTIDIEQLQKDIHKALKQYARTGRHDAISYLRASRASMAKHERDDGGNHVLRDALEQLRRSHPIHHELLCIHLLEGKPMSIACRVGNWGESTAYREQQFALRQLAEIVWEAEKRIYQELEARFFQRVSPSAMGKVFGLDRAIRRVLELLFERENRPIVLIEGVGGIGKTTLAERVALQAIVNGQVNDLGWVSAQMMRFTTDGAIRPLPDPLRSTTLLLDALTTQLLEDAESAAPVTTLERQVWLLQRQLKEKPSLLVFDNLETVTDLEALLPILRKLSNSAPILLTSRMSLPVESEIYHYRMQELDENDAKALANYEAELRGISAWRQATESEFAALYETVGGNPMALKLVLGQLRYHALDDILADVRAARGKSIKEMYRYIYQRAWKQLSSEERTVLLTLPLVAPRPGNVTFILEASGLPPETTRDALRRLVDLNLVDRRGDLRESYYTIHSLTRAFLEEQILQWR